MGLYGQSLAGVVVFQQTRSANGTKLVRAAFSDVYLFLGDGTAPATGTGDCPATFTGVCLAHGSGAVLITPSGFAGTVEGDVAVKLPGVGITGHLALEVNDLGVAVNETVQFLGVDVITTTPGDATTAEVQQVAVTVPSGTFTLAIDKNANGRIDSSEVSAPIAVGSSAATVQAAVDTLLGGSGIATVTTISGGYQVAWTAVGNQPQLQANVRVLSLAAGPYVRFSATGVTVTIGGATGVTLTADISIDRFGTTTKVTRIGFAHVSIASTATGISGDNPGLVEGQGALIIFPAGAQTDDTNSATTTSTGGIAGVITGSAGVAIGSFSAGGSVGVEFNTTGVAVNKTVTVGGTTIVVKLAATPTAQFIVQNLHFDFGGVLEIKAGQFAIGNDGTFSGSGLQIFVGHGPLTLSDGSANPDAIGVLVSNASMGFAKASDQSGFALKVTGTFGLLGLDGLSVSGTATFEANTSDMAVQVADPAAPGSTTSIAAGYYSFVATGVNISVAGVFTIAGTLALTREPNGDLDVTLAPMSILLTIDSTKIASLTGYADFSITEAAGFQLVNFKVIDFSLFPSSGLATPTTASAPTLFPTASLASPLNGAVVALGPTSIKVTFNDVNHVGLNTSTITDTAPEFSLYQNGGTTAYTGATIGQPTLVSGTTYSYPLSAALPSGLWTVRFAQAGFADNGGTTNMAGSQQFVVFTPPAGIPNAKPGPIASLTSLNGTTITASKINSQGYIDVTYTSLPATTGGTADPILKSSIETTTAPFTLTGTGVTGVKMTTGTHVPVLLGAPLLMTGRADTATSVTYRYFLAPSDPKYTTPMFSSGSVMLTFTAGAIRSGVAGGSAAAGSLQLNAASTQTFTIDPSAPGQGATSNGPKAIGPLTVQGPRIGLGDFGFKDGMVTAGITLGADRASLAFGSSATSNSTTPSSQQSTSGVSVDLLGLSGTFYLGVDVFGLLSGHVRVQPTGKWNVRVASLTATIPDLLTLSGTGITVGYDPNAPAGQTLVSINTVTVTVPRFSVTGQISPYNGQPGLVVRDNGFSIGTAELDYNVPNTPNTLSTTSSDGKINFGGILLLNDIRIGVSGLNVTFSPDVQISGQVWIATGGAQLFPGKAFSAELSYTTPPAGTTPTTTGTLAGQAFRVGVTFASDGTVTSFQMAVNTLSVKLGNYLTLTARNFSLDTGAIGTSNMLVSFQSVGAKVSVGSLVVTGEARNFGFDGNGNFITKPGFGVFLSVGSATGDSFQWPSFLPIRIDELGISWPDIQSDPSNFVLTLSASVTGIKGLGGLTFSGSIQGVQISPTLLAQGKFPIIGINSLGVTVSGNLFGGQINASLVGGILKLDSNYQIIGTFDTTTPVFKRVFYLGLQGGFSIAGMAGFTIRLGLSELGPLEVYINVNTPTGVLLVPQIGLTLNDFSAGVQFFKTLPSMSDPFALRQLTAPSPTGVTADTWMTSLQQQVATQAQAVANNPQLGGFGAAFTSPMVITGSARIYSIYTSQALFNGQVSVMISTDGKLLVIGKLNFANNNISLSGRLYVDLSKVAQGDATVLFLADIPDQVRLLTIYGKLQMGFRDSSGNPVTFDVVNPPDAVATATNPTIGISGPASDGGTVDVGTAASQTYDFGSGAHHYIDVTYTAPAGTSLDLASILRTGSAGSPLFTISENGNTPVAVTGKPVPLVSVNVPYGTVFVPLTCTLPSGNTPGVCTYSYSDTFGGTPDKTVTVDNATDLTTAAQITGTTRFRYDIGAADLPIGKVSLHFDAGAIKNEDLTTASGTTTGASNAATDLTFTVVGASGTIADPTPGSSVDVNVINDRQWLSWIDVTFTAPATHLIDPATLLDGRQKVTLSGSGVGTAAIDLTRTPLLIDSTTGLPLLGSAATTPGQSFTVRFFITGTFATTGTVTVTGVDGSWSLAGADSGSTTVTSVTVSHTTTDTTLALTLGSLAVPSGYVLDPATFADVDPVLPGIQLYSADGWTITIDTSRQITFSGGQFIVPVTITTGTTDATFTPQLSGTHLLIDSTTSTDYTSKAAAAASDPVNPLTLSDTPTSYLDVTFSPSVGSTLDLSTITGDEIGLSGPGAAGVALLPNQQPIYLGGTTFRYLLSGSFVPGLVKVSIILGNFSDHSGRSPPAGLKLTQSFTVTGPTATPVRTVTTTSGTSVVALGGSTVGVDATNALHYLEVRFQGSSGYAIDPATVNGGEIQLRDATGNLIALGTPVREGTTNIWRFPFTATLAAGKYTVDVVAGSFADTSGLLNLADSFTFWLASPHGALADPGSGSVLDTTDLNGRGYVDVTFPAINGSPIDPATVLDAAPEFTITASDGSTITVDPTPVAIDPGNGVYRYFFSGYKSGTLSIDFIDGSWATLAGHVWSKNGTGPSGNPPNQPADATPTTTLDSGTFSTGVWINVTLTPLPGTTVDVQSVLTAGGSLVTLSGAGVGTLAYSDVYLVGDATQAGQPVQFRYLYTGHAGTGAVTATFAAGAWHDSAGNGAVASSGTFQLITRGTSFYISLEGGIQLQAAGLTSEPLMDLKASVQLEIDPVRKVFKLTFDGTMSIIKLGTVGATSGEFVLDLGDPSTSVPQFWGVATLQTNFSALQPYGLNLNAKGTLQINLTGQTKDMSLTLKGIGPNGTDVTKNFSLQPYSFGVSLLGQVVVSVPTTNVELFREQGGIYLSIEALPTPHMVLYLNGTLSFGSGSAQLTYGSATAVLFIVTSPVPGVAGVVTVASGGGVGLPDVGTLFSVTGTVSLMFNTTLQQQQFTVPPDLLPLLGPNDPKTITVWASPPGLDGNPLPGAAPAAYIRATIQAQITIAQVLELNGYIGITAAVDTTGTAYFKIDGAVGATIPFLGSVTGVLNLAVYVGTTTGVVGRIQLTIGANTIPGVSFNGQFLLELNTFSSEQTIQTFAVNQATVNGHQVFGGFQRDAAGNLVVTSQTIKVTRASRCSCTATCGCSTPW